MSYIRDFEIASEPGRRITRQNSQGAQFAAIEPMKKKYKRINNYPSSSTKKYKSKMNQPVQEVTTQPFFEQIQSVGQNFENFANYSPAHMNHANKDIEQTPATAINDSPANIYNHNAAFSHLQINQQEKKRFKQFEYFQNYQRSQQGQKRINCEEHYDFIKKMREVCENIKMSEEDKSRETILAESFQKSILCNDIINLMNTKNNILLHGLGSKSFFFPVMARKLLKASRNAHVYFMDYNEQFLTLRKVLIRVIVNMAATIQEKKYNNQQKQFQNKFAGLVKSRGMKSIECIHLNKRLKSKSSQIDLKVVNRLLQMRKNTKMRKQISKNNQKSSSKENHQSKESDSQYVANENDEDNQDDDYSDQSEYKPKRRGSKASKSSKLSVTSRNLSIRSSRLSSSQFQIMSQQDSEKQQQEEQEYQHNDEQEFWNQLLQSGRLGQFANQLKKKCITVMELKAIMVALHQDYKSILGEQFLFINSIDLLAPEECLPGPSASRLGPFYRDSHQELQVIRQIASFDDFVVIASFQDVFFPLKVGSRFCDIFVSKQLHSGILERIEQSLSQLTTKVDSEIKGLGYIFKSLTTNQKELLKLIANYQSDHRSQPIKFEKLFELSVNNQLMTNRKQIKEALAIPLDQKLVKSVVIDNNYQAYSLVCSYAALDKVSKAEYL